MSEQVPNESAAGADGRTPDPVTYRLVLYRPLVSTVLIGLGLVGVALVRNVLLDPNAHPEAALRLFIGAWLVFLAVFAYWYLVRFAYEVGIVDGSILRWRSMTTSHEVPLARIRAIKTPFPPFGYGAKKIFVEGDRSPLMLISGGIVDVLGMFVQFRPDLLAQIDWYDRMAERMAYPRSWGWRRVESKTSASQR